MKRNMFETVRKAPEKLSVYDLSEEEMNQLYDLIMTEGALWKALYTAFSYGYVLGGRAKAKELKAR